MEIIIAILLIVFAVFTVVRNILGKSKSCGCSSKSSSSDCSSCQGCSSSSNTSTCCHSNSK